MNHRDAQILRKIIQEIDIAAEMMKEKSLKDFKNNEMLKRAVCMTVINIGELIKNVTDETRQENKQVPWKAAAGFRDIAAHKYQTLKMEDVFQTVTQDFPELRKLLTNILDISVDSFYSETNVK